MKKLYILLLLGMLGVIATTVPAPARENETELAKKLANPVADLISVPFQFNYDRNIGLTESGSQWRLNFQPVVPVSINESWNLVTRTIVPLIDQNDIPVSGRGESGFGDILASQFFSPRKPTKRGWIWGIGPVWLIPSASHDALGSGKWGLGPTAVILRQAGPWSYGALVNHVWSFAGNNDRPNVNATFLQPFLAYVTRTMTTVTINTESTYLEGGRVVGPDQPGGKPDGQDREAAGPVRGGGALLGGIAGQRTQWLGTESPGDFSLSDVTVMSPLHARGGCVGSLYRISKK